jgi:uncharacterized protein (TIGR03790 family)
MLAIVVTACSSTSDDPGPALGPADYADSALPPVDVDGGAADGGHDAPASSEPRVVAPTSALGPTDLGVIVNSDDPQSAAVGAYYALARGIPSANVITLALGASWSTAKTTTVPAATFAGWKAQIDAKTPANVQAYAVTFIYPSVVGCMSLTSAIAFGFDMKHCSTPCSTTATSPYFDSVSSTPHTTHAMRPAMVLAATTVAAAKQLVDRGVSSDRTFPLAQGYMIRTTDTARNVRWPDQASVKAAWNKPDSLAFEYVDNSAGTLSDVIANKNDVLYYFTGLASVADIATNKYVPGAVADHLTSYGGQIPTSGQMSILRWLEAGATGSYGTVVEPCNYTAKFSQASTFLDHYFRGETLIEAYWKSVGMPGEGLFIGEPLAKPYGTTSSMKDGALVIRTTSLVQAKTYRVESAPSADGPWTFVKGDIKLANRAITTIEIPSATAPYYRVVTP